MDRSAFGDAVTMADIQRKPRRFVQLKKLSIYVRTEKFLCSSLSLSEVGRLSKQQWWVWWSVGATRESKNGLVGSKSVR